MDEDRTAAIMQKVEEFRNSGDSLKRWIGTRLEVDIAQEGLDEYDYICEYVDAVQELGILIAPIIGVLEEFPTDDTFPYPEEEEEEEEAFDYDIPCPNCDMDFKRSRLPGLVTDGTWRTALCPECEMIFEYRGKDSYVLVVRKP